MGSVVLKQTCKRSKAHKFAWGIVAMAASLAVGSVSAGPISEKIRVASGYIVGADTEAVISHLPGAAAGTNRLGSCASSPVKLIPGAEGDSGWTLKGYPLQMNFWAIYHFGARAGTSQGLKCLDGQFTARAWQEALGETGTGTLTSDQARRFVNIVDQYDRSFAQAKNKIFAPESASKIEHQWVKALEDFRKNAPNDPALGDTLSERAKNLALIDKITDIQSDDDYKKIRENLPPLLRIRANELRELKISNWDNEQPN